MDLSKVKLRKTETKESKAPNVVLCATSEDYTRLMAETYIEQCIFIFLILINLNFVIFFI